MTYFPDLSPYRYMLPQSHVVGALYRLLSGRELNVGWLEPPHEFPRGTMAPELVEKLDRLCRASRYNQTRGFHGCRFCHDPDAHGSAEIRIPGKGVVYAAPTLIAHYVAVHGYAPPEEFVQALRSYPEPQADAVLNQEEE